MRRPTIVKERRVVPRYSVRESVDVIFPAGGSERRRYPAEIVDISMGGVAIVCAADLAVNSYLMLQLFPTQVMLIPASIHCLISNRRGGTYGLQLQPKSRVEAFGLDYLHSLLEVAIASIQAPVVEHDGDAEQRCEGAWQRRAEWMLLDNLKAAYKTSNSSISSRDQ